MWTLKIVQPCIHSITLNILLWRMMKSRTSSWLNPPPAQGSFSTGRRAVVFQHLQCTSASLCSPPPSLYSQHLSFFSKCRPINYADLQPSGRTRQDIKRAFTAIDVLTVTEATRGYHRSHQMSLSDKTHTNIFEHARSHTHTHTHTLTELSPPPLKQNQICQRGDVFS